MLDLLQYTKVSLLLYCVPWCADSYSSGSIYYVLYCLRCLAWASCSWSILRVQLLVCVPLYWCSILVLPSAAIMFCLQRKCCCGGEDVLARVGTSSRRALYQRHQQQPQHILYQDHYRHHVRYQDHCQHCVILFLHHPQILFLSATLYTSPLFILSHVHDDEGV